MSKKSKKASKLKRAAEKRARKAAKRALYESYRDKGQNTKSKRARAKAKQGKSLRPRNHPHGPCGNVGCIKCFGIRYKPFLVKGEPKGMPHWMWLRWKELSREEQRKHAA